MRRQFLAGDRVRTPQGAGTVVYRRFQPPNFAEAAAYSVRIDGRNHEGTIVGALDVRALEDEPAEGASGAELEP